MAKQFIKQRMVWIGSGGLLIVLCVVLFISLNRPVSHNLDMEPYRPSFLSFTADQAEWKPQSIDAYGYADAANNEKFTLLYHPDNGQFIVRDKFTGMEWRSNPSEDGLADETVSGLLRSNMDAAFIMEHHQDQSNQKKVINSTDKNLVLTPVLLENGVQANYEFTNLQIKFSIRYELSDKGLTVFIPEKSIEELDINRVISINLLPFFGAANANSEEGYMFVPDGPGGIIRFPQSHELVGKGYFQSVYGTEITNTQAQRGNIVPIAMPVFGMKRNEQAFIALITSGEFTAQIRAYPSGIVSSMNSISTRFVFREEFDRRTSLAGSKVRSFQSNRMKQDSVIQFHFLSGDDADYVGMAKAYRHHLQETNQITDRLHPVDHIPMELTIIGGDANEYGRKRYIPTTTFNQAKHIVQKLSEQGVHNMQITFSGWQKNGFLSKQKGFPHDRSLGSKNELHSFIDISHELGHKVSFLVDLITGYPGHLNLSPKTYGIRGIEGDVFIDKNELFYLNPNISYNLTQEIASQLKEYDIDGIVFDEIGNTVYRDYNPKFMYTRAHTATLFKHMLKHAQEELGYASVFGGNAYSLSYLNHISGMPAHTNNFYEIDEAVPFYPIALHGSISYSIGIGNLRNNFDDEFLLAIEYGAIPSFLITNEPSRSLLDTWTWGIYSSKFEEWEQQIVDEYAKFDLLSSTFHEAISDHWKIEDGVYVTAYENGVTVTVNYNDKSFQVDKEVSS